MESARLSHIVSETCKKMGIPYCSNNPQYSQFLIDAEKLRDIYIQLKCIVADLVEIEERHKIEGLSRLLVDDIKQLDVINHDVIKIATRLKSEETQ